MNSRKSDNPDGERMVAPHREAPRAQLLLPSILRSPQGSVEPLYCVNQDLLPRPQPSSGRLYLWPLKSHQVSSEQSYPSQKLSWTAPLSPRP